MPALLPRLAWAQVKDHQMPRFRPAPVHVRRRLLQPLPEQAIQADFRRAHLALDDVFAGARKASPPGLAPFNQQVRAPAAHRVLPPNPPAAVHHPLQVRMQYQLRPRLRVPVPLHP